MNIKLILVITSLCLSHAIFAQNEITSSFFGDIRARHIGPGITSGRISDLEMHPKDPNFFLAGTAGGGVWKSTNGGQTFNSIFDDNCQSIGTVAIDPSDPDKTYWVGTGETWVRNSTSIGDGIYKTIDGGLNWEKMGLEKTERISSILIHPENPNEIYVGVLGALWSDSEHRGVYKTTDGGKTWNKLFFIDNKTGCSDLVVDPHDFNTMYACFWEFRRTAWSFESGGKGSGLYKTTDGGKTWNKIQSGFPQGDLGRIAFAITPSNSKILYAVVEAEKNKGLYKSTDGGSSWTFLNGDFGLVVRPFYFSRIVVDPKNPDIVIKGGLFGSKSLDGGKTFKDLGRTHADVHDIVFNPTNTKTIFVATDGGIYRSEDAGNTFSFNENLPVGQYYHISIDHQEPYNIYGGLQDNGSWIAPSSNSGILSSDKWKCIGYGDGFRVYPHPENPNIIYSEMQGAENVWRYNYTTKQTKLIQPYQEEGDPKLRFNWNAPLTTSPNKPDRLWIGSQFLYKSENMGDKWVKISGDLTTNDPKKQNQEESGGLSKDNSGAETNNTIFTIAESPKNEQVIWVGTDDGNIQITKNGGKTWENVVKNIPNLPAHTWCYHIEASIYDAGIAYAVFDGHTRGDFKPYVYRTTDYGQSWQDLGNSDIKTFARSIQEDINSPNILYLGTEMGLYISLDRGLHWVKFTNNMPSVAIHYMEMDKKTGDLIMGTHGRGAIIIDHISRLSELTLSNLDSSVFFFQTPPLEFDETENFEGGNDYLQFKGENNYKGLSIMYYLKKKPIFGKVTLDIYDERGKIVRSLVPHKLKGINIVKWDGRMNPPKIAEAKTIARGGFSTPRVSAGKYKVVLKLGETEYSHIYELIYPKNSIFSLKERELQENTVRELIDMNETLAYSSYRLDELAKNCPEISKTIESMKTKYMVMSGDNYVGAKEPKLREKMANLYSDVTWYYGAPSHSQLTNKDVLKTKLNEAVKEMDEFFTSSQSNPQCKQLSSLKVSTKTDYLNEK